MTRSRRLEMSSSRLGRRICVIGNAGAGKSTVAGELASRLGLRRIVRNALV